MIGIFPYKKGLESTSLLKGAGATVLNKLSKPRRGRVCHSWGMREIPAWSNRVLWVNNPAAIPLVSNKLNWFRTGLGPESTESKEEAQAYAAIKGNKIVCRTKLEGCGGAGIVIARNAEQVVDAPVYTMYHKKSSEYRVMFSPSTGLVYAWSKRRPEGREFTKDELLIRTDSMGYVYQREREVPLAVTLQLNKVGAELEKLGLNLGAYDVGYNKADDTAVVYEVNTAPGLNEDTAACTMRAIKMIGGYLRERR